MANSLKNTKEKQDKEKQDKNEGGKVQICSTSEQVSFLSHSFHSFFIAL